MLDTGRPVAVDDSQTSQWRSVERLMSLPPGWKILRNGDISWLEPEPSFEWYRRFYNEGYLSDAQNPVFPGDAKFEAKRLAYFTRRLSRIERHLGRKPESILEIGAGDGLFLLAAQKYGIEATGIDLSEQAREDAQRRFGIKIMVGDLIHSDLPIGDSYSVVVMNHVLEHLVAPDKYLKRVRELLQPDGLLVFEIPQQFINPVDLTYRALGIRRPLGVYTLHHPYFYTVSSIRRFMEHAGLRIERLVTWLPGQVYHVQNPWITKPLQTIMWLADKLAGRGHIIEVFARPR